MTEKQNLKTEKDTRKNVWKLFREITPRVIRRVCIDVEEKAKLKCNQTPKKRTKIMMQRRGGRKRCGRASTKKLNTTPSKHTASRHKFMGRSTFRNDNRRPTRAAPLIDRYDCTGKKELSSGHYSRFLLSKPVSPFSCHHFTLLSLYTRR